MKDFSDIFNSSLHGSDPDSELAIGLLKLIISEHETTFKLYLLEYIEDKILLNKKQALVERFGLRSYELTKKLISLEMLQVTSKRLLHEVKLVSEIER